MIPPDVEQMAAEEAARWRSRKEAWLDGWREGAQHTRTHGQDDPRYAGVRRAMHKAMDERDSYRRALRDIAEMENCDESMDDYLAQRDWLRARARRALVVMRDA